MKAIKQKPLSAVFLAVLICLMAGLFVFFASDNPAAAVTREELEQRTSDLEQQIANNEAVLDDLAQQASTLQNRLQALKTEINNANKQIELTTVKIDKLTIELEQTEAELVRQKDILVESIRTLYKHADVSTLELLLGSDNFTEFFNEQEYLETLKVTVQESADRVEALKLQIEEEKEKQETLLDEQEAQKRNLVNKQNEQAALLEQTQGREAQYQSIVADLKEQRKEAELALAAFIARGNFVSLGPVAQGDTIGTVGSTGFSTGPHLHFEVRDANSGGVTDPMPFINSGWIWPVPATDHVFNQVFGCVPSYWYVTPCPNGSLHPGIDTGYSGASVVAMATGSIIARGCSIDYLGTPAYGYIVMIDHGNGYTSLYAHMLPPDIPEYAHCNYSYGF